MSKFETLAQYLEYLESAHQKGLIDMGLQRVSRVKEAMQLKEAPLTLVVAGTNGKGSVCAVLTQLYTEAGYRVGTLTSPHLLKFNERIAINGQSVSDEAILEAFERIEKARGTISLTYFEFNTLAAVAIFERENVDVMVLEVGLGGRLDAVNVFNANVAVITSIGLDHGDYLGHTTAEVAREKAGIMRPNCPVVIGAEMQDILEKEAEKVGAPCFMLQRDFSFQTWPQQWSFHFHPRENIAGSHVKRHALPIPALRGAFQVQNAALALAAVQCAGDAFPLDMGAIKRAMVRVTNRGRFQVLPGRPLTVLDVGHNPHAAKALRQSLITLPFAKRRIAVFSMLSDKDVSGVVELLHSEFDAWYIAPLNVPRAMDVAALEAVLRSFNIKEIKVFDSVQVAYEAARHEAKEDDRIVVTGSFHTVAAVSLLSNEDG